MNLSPVAAVSFLGFALAALEGQTTPDQYSPSHFAVLKGQATDFVERFPHRVLKDISPLLRFDALSLRGESTGISVRRATVNGLNVRLMEVSETECPQIAQVAEAFSRLPPPRTRLEDVNGQASRFYIEGPPDELLTGGPHYTVRSFARFSNLSASQLEYTAGNVSPVAEWFETSMAALQPCWDAAALLE